MERDLLPGVCGHGGAGNSCGRQGINDCLLGERGATLIPVQNPLLLLEPDWARALVLCCIRHREQFICHPTCLPHCPFEAPFSLQSRRSCDCCFCALIGMMESLKPSSSVIWRNKMLGSVVEEWEIVHLFGMKIPQFSLVPVH